ncbi:FAS1 domain-containing protein [Apodospora peruviana]|uniref:FAS1 domain-containing protein n=1 Tax=Apodospora peruviana TaxID=516989 RepID=A0AAE0IQ67_9PEZI|nr:FAS1 domain-containing protein [Apodospora peruviana]
MHPLRLFGLLSHIVTLVYSQSLQTVLQDNGLTEFLQELRETDPDLLDVPAGSKLIVYAPSNEAVNGSSVIVRRDDSKDEEKKKQIARNQIHFANTIAPILRRRQSGDAGGTAAASGSVFRTLLNGSEFVNLGPGKNQSVVEKSLSGAPRPEAVFSGLGAKANVVAADIPFDGGVIRPIDQFLVLPRNLSTSLPALGLGDFKSALERTGLLETFDKATSLTILAPQNSALENSSCWWSDAKLTSALKLQVLVDFPGYTPLLKNNAKYRTLGGTSVTVVIRDNKIFVGGAEILAADAIIKNGVLHTVDRWVSAASPPSPPPIVAAATGLSLSTHHWILVVMGMAVATGFSL